MEQLNVPKLELKEVRKVFNDREFGENEVLKSISFSVEPNEFLVILGPGLSGKTVLLNIIAGLEKATSGSVLLDGAPITDGSPKISMVFQKTGLLAWKSVIENIEVGLLYTDTDPKERRARAQKYLDLVGLTGFENHWPKQISGGMKQRAGIARAYTADPDVLLMDEPFGALDAQTRYSMEDEILRIWGMEKKTIVFVTNNIEEAVYLGDRIVLLSDAPSTIKNTFKVDLPRPRNQMSEGLLVLDDISFSIKKGEFVCVVGPTGCGKTTFLNLLCCLLEPTSGQLLIDGVPADPQKHDIAFVFQEPSSFPWLTVEQNISFGLDIKRKSAEERKKSVDDIIALMGLERFRNSYPSQLSMSSEQRMVIGRAFAMHPDLLLMDEPYSQMDIKMRFYLEDEVIKLWKATGTTVIFITHNIEEAVYMAERVLILTNKPAKVKESVQIDLPRPRDVSSPDFIRYRKYITDQIRWW